MDSKNKITEKYEKYLIAFPLVYDSFFREVVIEKMRYIANLQKDSLPHNRKIEPHITFHKPISDVPLSEIINKVNTLTKQVNTKLRIRVGGIDHFGSRYFIIPVQATFAVAQFWINIFNIFGQYCSECGHLILNNDNVLHVTIGKCNKPEDLIYFNSIWAMVKKHCNIGISDIVIECIAIYGQNPDKTWEKVYELPLL